MPASRIASGAPDQGSMCCMCNQVLVTPDNARSVTASLAPTRFVVLPVSIHNLGRAGMNATILLSLACLLPVGVAPPVEPKPDLATAKKLLLGTWEFPSKPVAFRMKFSADGTLTISLYLSEKWQHSKTSYQWFDESTIEVTVAAMLFPERAIKQKWGVELSKGRVKFKLPSGGGAIPMTRRD